jgi:hypothetical protein
MKSFASPATRRARAPRVRVPNHEPVRFVVEGKPLAGYLHTISITGGLASTAGPVKEGTFADIALQTALGKVTGAIEFLRPRDAGYAFRFVYLDTKDQERLNSTLSLMRKQGLSA